MTRPDWAAGPEWEAIESALRIANAIAAEFGGWA